MKKLEKRSIFCMILAVLLLLSGGIFTYRFVTKGGTWASFPSNRHLYNNGILASGQILDRNGTILSSTTEDGTRIYHKDKTIRLATLHAVGDSAGRIGTGAQTFFASKLSGYNILTGAHPIGGSRNLFLTIDADVCAAAYKALNGKKGTVGVYNYKTGDIICMVSSPTFDPKNPPEIEDGDETYEGVYLNRLLSSVFPPGSIFKLVTTAAAIETMDDLYDQTFQCNGRFQIGDTTITCSKAHGTLSIQDALAVSCNCTYGQLALELGADTLNHYVKKTGLTSSLSIDGIHTATSTFSFSGSDAGSLAWGGIGQGKDLINPCAMMVYVGAIANGGRAQLPHILSKLTTAHGLSVGSYSSGSTGQLISQQTAAQLTEMMRNNVVTNYGANNFPNLNICAKSGTAETGNGNKPHAWFTGFLRDDEHPYAFIVLVENGGSGSAVAGKVANTVLQAAVRAN